MSRLTSGAIPSGVSSLAMSNHSGLNSMRAWVARLSVTDTAERLAALAALAGAHALPCFTLAGDEEAGTWTASLPAMPLPPATVDDGAPAAHPALILYGSSRDGQRCCGLSLTGNVPGLDPSALGDPSVGCIYKLGQVIIGHDTLGQGGAHARND